MPDALRRQFHAETGNVTPLDVPPADSCDPVAYVASHGKILAVRASDGDREHPAPEGGPVEPEYRLIDPATWTSEVVEGEFRPLADQTYRPLQPTGRPDEYWAAIDETAQINHKFTTAVRVGRYDAKRFAFTPVVTLPDVRFSSMEMWVDEPGGGIYVAVNGDLLRIPLPQGPVPSTGRASTGPVH